MADYHKVLRKDYGVLDFTFDWAPNRNGDTTKTDWLATGETLTLHVVTVESGLIKVSDGLVLSNSGVSVWVNAKSSDLGTYLITCSIATSNNREDARTLEVEVI